MKITLSSDIPDDKANQIMAYFSVALPEIQVELLAKQNPTPRSLDIYAGSLVLCKVNRGYIYRVAAVHTVNGSPTSLETHPVAKLKDPWIDGCCTDLGLAYVEQSFQTNPRSSSQGAVKDFIPITATPKLHSFIDNQTRPF